MEEKNFKKTSYFVAIVYIVLGMAMSFFPSATLDTLCIILATIIGLTGIVCLFMYFSRDIKIVLYRHDFVIGIILILIALIVFFKREAVINIIPLVMGIIIFASGVIKLQHAINLARVKYSGWIFVLIISMICIVLGIFVIINPNVIASVIIVFIGISMIISGGTDIIILLMIGRGLKIMNKENSVVVDVDGTISNIKND